jgi:hypothetical protein
MNDAVYIMTTFNDLPTELLPSILQHLSKPSQLANACLVNKKFYAFAVADLYQIATILPWYKDSKVRVYPQFLDVEHSPISTAAQSNS